MASNCCLVYVQKFGEGDGRFQFPHSCCDVSFFYSFLKLKPETFFLSLPMVHFPVSLSIAICGPDHRHAKRWNEIVFTVLLCFVPLFVLSYTVENSIVSLLP